MEVVLVELLIILKKTRRRLQLQVAAAATATEYVSRTHCWDADEQIEKEKAMEICILTLSARLSICNMKFSSSFSFYFSSFSSLLYPSFLPSSYLPVFSFLLPLFNGFGFLELSWDSMQQRKFIERNINLWDQSLQGSFGMKISFFSD